MQQTHARSPCASTFMLPRICDRSSKRLCEHHLQELEAAQQLLDKGEGGVERQALARQLADQLEAQMARLERSRDARLRQLAAAAGACVVGGISEES